MKHQLEKQYQTLALCYSDDDRYIYAASRLFNELIIYDTTKEEIVKIIHIEQEENAIDLFCVMIYCNGRLLLIPRNARYYHIYDCNTDEQWIIDEKEFAEDFKIKTLGAIGFLHDNLVYVVNRMPFRMFSIDLNQRKVKEIKLSKEICMSRVDDIDFIESDIYVFSHGEKKCIKIDNNTLKVSQKICTCNVSKIKQIRVWRGAYYVLDYYKNVYCYDQNFDLLDSKSFKREVFFFHNSDNLYLVEDTGEKCYDAQNNFKEIALNGKGISKLHGVVLFGGNKNRIAFWHMDEAEGKENTFSRKLLTYNVSNQKFESFGICLSEEEEKRFEERHTAALKDFLKIGVVKERPELSLQNLINEIKND